MRKHKRRKNPEQVYSTKKSAEGKLYRDKSHIFPTKGEAAALNKKAMEYEKKYAAAPEASASKKLYRLKMVKAQQAAKKALESRIAELKTVAAKRSEGWKLKLKHIKAGKKARKSKKAKSASSKGEAVAKKRKHKRKKHAKKVVHHKRRKHAKKVHHKRRKHAKKVVHHKRRKHHKKSKHLKKLHALGAVPKKHKRRRKHRRYAKRITHSHSRKVHHVKRGQTMSGVIYSKGKGKKRSRANVRIKFNPFGGLKMKVSVKDLTGYEGYAEPLALLAGGAVYQKVNALLQQYVPAQIQAFTLKVPGVGPALLPILAGIGLHMAGKKVPGKAGEMVSLLGEGLIGAAVVGAGVSLSSSLPFLSSPVGVTTPVAGVQYTPMSGVQYTPMSGVQYTPALGRSPDFGRAADYGGGAGYTQSQPFSTADFGADDDDSEGSEGSEDVSLGNSPYSQMG